MTRPTCSSCRFWCGSFDADVVAAKITSIAGQCRAKAPAKSGWWPTTRASDWCGDHTGHPPAAEAMFALREDAR